MPYANQNEASPSLGAANCQAVATFVAPSSLLLCQIVVAFLPIILVARVMPRMGNICLRPNVL